MEIIKINETSIKISLLANEAKEYEIFEDITGDESLVKGSFSRLLKAAKEKLGVTWADKRVLAEVFSSKDGGYDIFISHIDSDESKIAKDIFQKARSSLAFLFDSGDEVIITVKRLSRIFPDVKASLYYDESLKKYYLILDNVSKKEPRLGFIYEFAKGIRASSLPYISEHFKSVIKSKPLRELN